MSTVSVMLQQKIVKKVPGIVLAPSGPDRQGYIEDLSLKTKAELLELIERQDKLLANKSFIGKLPDKGEKIFKFRSHLAEVLSQRDDIEKVCDLFSGLNIGKYSVPDEMEWTGKPSETSYETQPLDSDEERNPFIILATQSGVGRYKKQHKVEEPDESLIKQEDLKDIESCVNCGVEGSEQDGDVYVKRLCGKFEKPKGKEKDPFRPNRIAKVNSDGQSPNTQQIKKPLGPHWEVTAATPPQPIYGDVKLISLQESLQLQKEQAAKLKDIQAKHTSEKLMSQLGLAMGVALPDPSVCSLYHDKYHHTHSSSISEDEMSNIEGQEEDEEPEKDGVVVYNTIN